MSSVTCCNLQSRLASLGRVVHSKGSIRPFKATPKKRSHQPHCQRHGHRLGVGVCTACPACPACACLPALVLAGAGWRILLFLLFLPPSPCPPLFLCFQPIHVPLLAPTVTLSAHLSFACCCIRTGLHSLASLFSTILPPLHPLLSFLSLHLPTQLHRRPRQSFSRESLVSERRQFLSRLPGFNSSHRTLARLGISKSTHVCVTARRFAYNEALTT